MVNRHLQTTMANMLKKEHSEEAESAISVLRALVLSKKKGRQQYKAYWLTIVNWKAVRWCTKSLDIPMLTNSWNQLESSSYKAEWVRLWFLWNPVKTQSTFWKWSRLRKPQRPESPGFPFCDNLKSEQEVTIGIPVLTTKCILKCRTRGNISNNRRITISDIQTIRWSHSSRITREMLDGQITIGTQMVINLNLWWRSTRYHQRQLQTPKSMVTMLRKIRTSNDITVSKRTTITRLSRTSTNPAKTQSRQLKLRYPRMIYDTNWTIELHTCNRDNSHNWSWKIRSNNLPFDLQSIGTNKMCFHPPNLLKMTPNK